MITNMKLTIQEVIKKFVLSTYIIYAIATPLLWLGLEA